MVKTKRQSKSRQPPEEEHEEPTPKVTSKRHSSKRVRTAKKKTKGKAAKKAKLSMLSEMPADILYETFSLVHPRDLLNISRTAKALNRFLTSKSSRAVWQASFEGIPEEVRPPPCPPGITEMAYAKLVYEEYCMNCADEGLMSTAWNVLVRICEQCAREITVTDLPQSQLDGLAPTLMKEVLPTFRLEFGYYRDHFDSFLRSDMERFEKEFSAARGSESRDAVVETYKSLVRKRGEFSDAMSDFRDREDYAEVLAEEEREWSEDAHCCM